MTSRSEDNQREFDLATEPKETHAFIQWKGTEVCMDFWCDCGEVGHFDGWAPYVVKCPTCGTLWEMPSILFPRKSQRPQEHAGVVTFEADDPDDG